MMLRTTGPCGGDPRGTSPTVLTAGTMLAVQFQEVQDHGNFQLFFSPANDADFTLLATVPDPASGPVTQMVMLPATPCDACTLQLVQLNNGNSAGQYYSCADIQLVGAGTTTTTTTLGGGASTSTTTTTLKPDDPCADLSGFEDAGCRLRQAEDEPACEEEPVDPALETALARALQKAQALVARARDAGSPTQAARLLRKADRKLARILVKAARTAARQRISDSCEGSIAILIEDLRGTLAALL
jgi:hypothetical protein